MKELVALRTSASSPTAPKVAALNGPRFRFLAPEPEDATVISAGYNIRPD
jgi:hypothetical protein